MATVDQLLKVKGSLVHTVSKTATVYDAIAQMVHRNIGSLVVVNEAEAPVGIITERDYLRRVALEGRSSKTTFVQEIMSTDLVSVDLTTEIEECMRLMTHRRIRHLPVQQESHLVGVVSIGDIVRELARERESTIKELTSYIQGSYA
jgi:CBS domain-containing protein